MVHIQAMTNLSIYEVWIYGEFILIVIGVTLSIIFEKTSSCSFIVYDPCLYVALIQGVFEKDLL